ncbi:MAG: AbrB/MazE/SpoVT family DNA-binding domain-containing protein [Opitutaceae bacterium]
MQITLSSKGQIVLPALMRRALGLRSRSKIEIEERDGGLFIRAAGRSHSFAPIEYAPPGAIKLSRADYELDRLAGEDDSPTP